jgi:hypothetical protein
MEIKRQEVSEKEKRRRRDGELRSEKEERRKVPEKCRRIVGGEKEKDGRKEKESRKR